LTESKQRNDTYPECGHAIAAGGESDKSCALAHVGTGFYAR
jgi:hypothetical protein